MKIELRSTDSLRPYSRNPRRNDHAVQQMVASIREYGFKIPLLVRSDGEVIGKRLSNRIYARSFSGDELEYG